jgi:hypothetical protein
VLQPPVERFPVGAASDGPGAVDVRRDAREQHRGAGEQVDRGVPGSRSCAVRAPRGSSAARGTAFQGLDLRFFVHAEHCCVRRRGQVQAHHVAVLVDQQRVRGDLEGFGAPGLQPERQMRCTLVGEMPTGRAGSRFDQCVPSSGTSSRVRTTTSSTWASVMVRGTPGPGSSVNPSSRRRANRERHLATAPRLTPSRAATAMFGPTSAQASTIRARNARPCAVLRRLAQFSNVRRSSCYNTSGSSLVSAIPPADRRPAALSSVGERFETEHDSSGARRTQDRDTSGGVIPMLTTTSAAVEEMSVVPNATSTGRLAVWVVSSPTWP